MSSPSDFPPGYLQEYIGYRLKVVAAVFLVIDVAFVALRFWSRRIQGRKMHADDWLIIPSLIFCIGMEAVAIVAVNYGGVGRHLQYVVTQPVLLETWYKTCLIAVPVIYTFAAALPKIAVLAIFLQIFTFKWARYITWSLIAITIINGIVFIPLLVYKCDPISFGWESILNPTLTDGWCVDLEPRFRYVSLANLVSDVVMIIIPLPIISGLNANKTTKLGLFLTFLLGSIGLVTSVLRLTAFFATNILTDATWASINLVYWCIIEPSIYLIAACLLAFRPLANHIMTRSPLARFFGSVRAKSRAGVTDYEMSRGGGGGGGGFPTAVLASRQEKKRRGAGPYSHLDDPINDTLVEAMERGEGAESPKKEWGRGGIVVKSEIYTVSRAASQES